MQTTQTTIYADSGRINVEGNNIVFTLFSGEIHELDITNYEKYQRIYFKKHKISLPADDMILERREKSRRGEREMDIAMMYKEVKKYKSSRENVQAKIDDIVKAQLNISEYKNFKSVKKVVDAKIDSNTAYLSEAKANLENRKLTGIINRIKNEENLKKNYKRKINSYMVEIHKKLSMPFACIIFVMIGTPIGVMSRQGGIALGAVTSIFFFLIYYVFLIGGEELADMAIISPFWAMWSSNILLGAVGIYLIYRATYELKSLDILAMLNVVKKIKEKRKDAGS
jgi:lipopolysaccharide export system permease protein